MTYDAGNLKLWLCFSSAGTVKPIWVDRPSQILKTIQLSCTRTVHIRWYKAFRITESKSNWGFKQGCSKINCFQSTWDLDILHRICKKYCYLDVESWEKMCKALTHEAISTRQVPWTLLGGVVSPYKDGLEDSINKSAHHELFWLWVTSLIRIKRCLQQQRTKRIYLGQSWDDFHVTVCYAVVKLVLQQR